MEQYKEVMLGFEQKMKPIKNTYHNQEYNLDFYREIAENPCL